MDGVLPILFLAVVLKIPVFAGMYLIWYAVNAEPETEDAPGDGEHGFRRWRREPRGPRGPRRGPHGGAVSLASPRSRLPHKDSDRRRTAHGRSAAGRHDAPREAPGGRGETESAS
jgi:hypothetical protein